MGRTGAPDRRRGTGRRLTDAGATLVEYAMVISLLAVVSIPAAQYVTDGTREQVDNEATCVSRRPPPPECQIPTLPPPPPPDPGPVDPPDDGEPLPVPAGATWGTRTTGANPDGTWWVEVLVTVKNGETAADRIENARVVARADVTNPSGGLPVYIPCTTDVNGTCTIRYQTSAPLVRQVRIRMDSVTSDPPTTTLDTSVVEVNA